MSADQDENLEFDTNTRLDIPPGRYPMWAVIVLVLFGGILIAAAIVTLREQPDATSIFFLLVGVLMVGLPFFVLAKQRRSPMGGATLAPEGLAVPGTDGKLIPWSEITGIQVKQVRMAQMLGIGLTDVGRGYLSRSEMMNKVTKATEAGFGPGDVAIIQHMVAMPLGMFYMLLLAYAAEHGKQDWAEKQLFEIAEVTDEPST